MKERPILFSAPMVRATLAGTKTQTRRVCKPAEAKGLSCVVEVPDPKERGQVYNGSHFGDEEGDVQFASPYGGRGDRLWVRENGWERPERTPRQMREGANTWAPYYFDADGLSWSDLDEFKAWGFKRRPSIHMPRWASRILLESTAVRVERLQDISEADAIAEGIYEWMADLVRDPKVSAADVDALIARYGVGPRAVYAALWDHINGPGSCDANPWVWVVEFRRITP